MTYSAVEVLSSDSGGADIDGRMRLSFYNWDEPFPDGSDYIVIRDTNENGLKIRKVVDRSGIVGALRKMEFFSSAGTGGRPVQTREPMYAFSEELSDGNGVQEKPGVLFNSTKLTRYHHFSINLSNFG